MNRHNRRRKLAKALQAWEENTSINRKQIASIPCGIKGKGSVKADGRSFGRWKRGSQFKGATWLRKGL